jgi:ferritin-like metal-binding protein YciE
MEECRKILLTWLNNAYSMELSIVETLEKHAEALAGELPEMREKLMDHIQLTKDQAERVKDEIERLGGEVSGVKATLAKIFGDMSGLLSEAPRDRIVKNAIAEHATEHFEMASYLAIAKVADICGEEETAEMAREIAMEERTTGEELERKLGMIIEHFMAERTEEEEY